MQIRDVNSSNLQSGRASTLFVVLVTAICCTFFFFLLSAYWQQHQTNSLNEAEEMQVHGASGKPSPASAPPLDKYNRYNIDRHSNLKKTVERLRGAIVNQDEVTFAKELSPLLALAEPYDEQRLSQNKSSSDFARTIWFNLRRLLPLAFAHRATFAVDSLLAHNIQCDPTSSVGQDIIQAVAEQGDIAALEYYIKSECANQSFDLFAVLIKKLPIQVLPQALPIFSEVLIKPVPLEQVSSLLDHFYYKDQIKSIEYLVGFAPIAEAMRSSEMTNLAVRALANGKLELTRIIIESNAIHPKLRKSVVRSLIEDALAKDSEANTLQELFQMRGEQALLESELEGYLRAIITTSATPSDERLLNFVLAKVERVEEHQAPLQQALIRAVRSHNLPAVKTLLDAGVDPNPLFLGTTLISIAQSSAPPPITSNH